MSEVSPPQKADNLVELLLQLIITGSSSEISLNSTIQSITEQELASEIDCQVIAECLRRYNTVGDAVCNTAVRILSKTTQTLTKSIAFALAECLELNIQDLETFRTCHHMLSRCTIQVKLLTDLMTKFYWPNLSSVKSRTRHRFFSISYANGQARSRIVYTPSLLYQLCQQLMTMRNPW